MLGRDVEICHRIVICRLTLSGVGDAKQRRGVDGGKHREARCSLNDPAAVLCDAEVGAKKGLGGRCPKADDQMRFGEGLDL